MSKIKRYSPLITIIVVTILASAAIAIASYEGYTVMRFMHLFMGIFLMLFAILKLFDLAGFAKGFARYDLLAKRCRPYGYIYPFLELTLALGYLAGGCTDIYIATIALMSFGAIGVLSALYRGLDTTCACLGTTLNVPLSTVAITENIGMAIMAVFMLIK